MREKKKKERKKERKGEEIREGRKNLILFGMDRKKKINSLFFPCFVLFEKLKLKE